LKQLKKAGKDQNIRSILTKMLDKIEKKGPNAGKLLDSKLFLYEIKNNRPPIRLYYKHNKIAGEIYVFEYEMKTSSKKQKDTIRRLKGKALES
tara:strand:- start:405 stop:683 length:279 start_codon:yes stop_codon:yes gene_type:complete